MPNLSLDVNGFCRRWRDSNGHLFTLERIEPDTGRGGDALLLHGTSSDCTCMQHGLQMYTHDGPHTLHADSPTDLAHGHVFGFSPAPQTIEDLARFVSFLLTLTEDEWSHIVRVLDENDDDLDDFDEWVTADVSGAAWALQMATPDAPDYRPLRVVCDMVVAGHREPTLIAAAIIARLAPTEAAALPADLPDADRRTLVQQLTFLNALS